MFSESLRLLSALVRVSHDGGKARKTDIIPTFSGFRKSFVTSLRCSARTGHSIEQTSGIPVINIGTRIFIKFEASQGFILGASRPGERQKNGYHAHLSTISEDYSNFIML